MSTPETTIVVTQERRRRFPVPLVAGVAAAVLIGGSTFALWSVSQSLDGGTITAGDLDLTLASTGPDYYDVSDDRADAEALTIGDIDGLVGHAIDASTWRMVPGDTVAVVYEVEVTLEGDNMIGALSVDVEDAALLIPEMDYAVEVYLADGTQLDVATDGVVYLAAPETGQGGDPDAEATTPVHAMATNSETLTVVVFGTFDPDTSDRDSVTVTETLAGVSISLKQVRTAGMGQFLP
ncbi:MAG: alternate-type signal peptide domain-containing protein [Micrococcales bacterium]|nr:alternate-type signal peptide domain-containing protein [Micrococcales bacterium]